MADYPDISRKLENVPDTCIWLDRIELEMAALSQHQGVRFVADLLARSYEPVAVGEHGWLFRRRLVERLDQTNSMAIRGHFRAGP